MAEITTVNSGCELLIVSAKLTGTKFKDVSPKTRVVNLTIKLGTILILLDNLSTLSFLVSALVSV